MYFCWLNPGEQVGEEGGDDAQPRVICPAAGGFVYLFTKDGSPAPDADMAEPADWDSLPGCYFECEGTGEDKEIVPLLPSTALGSFRHAQAALGFFGTRTLPQSLSDDILINFDKDGSGDLDVTELRAFLSTAFPKLSCRDSDVQTFLAALDLDQDGTVNVTELRAFLRCYDPLSENIRKRTALVIIDVQNDFISGTLANPFNGVEIVPVINGIRDQFDVVVISYDWHPHHHCSFVESANDGQVAIKDEPREFKFLDVVTLLGDDDRPEHQQVLYVRHAVQESWGGMTHPDLVVKESDKKLYKGTKANIDSYSAFFDNCKANDTGLTGVLSEEKVTHVYCCGLVYDICVKSSALHGAEMGFKTTVIEDACKPLIKDNVAISNKELQAAGVSIMTAADAVADAQANIDCSIQEWLQGAKGWCNARRIHKELTSCSHSAIDQ